MSVLRQKIIELKKFGKTFRERETFFDTTFKRNGSQPNRFQASKKC